MSIHSVPISLDPENEGPQYRVFPGSYKMVGIIAGFGLLAILPGKSYAENFDRTYGHAEITVGFPNGHVTVGKTWDNNPREVVVEEVTHRYPESDRHEREEREDRDDRRWNRDNYDDDDAETIVIEKRIRPCPPKKVVIIERYERPRYCERREVIRRVYVEPRCHRSERIVYREPERVIYVPSNRVSSGMDHRHESSPNVIVIPSDRGSGSRDRDGYSKPRDLFPEDHDRPMRTRGVQNRVAMGGG